MIMKGEKVNKDRDKKWNSWEYKLQQDNKSST